MNFAPSQVQLPSSLLTRLDGLQDAFELRGQFVDFRLRAVDQQTLGIVWPVLSGFCGHDSP
jgi:hypothetical protein